MNSINYYCTGALAFSVGYFIYHKEWAKMNSIDAEFNAPTKVLTRTWDNRFDWRAVLFCIVIALFQFLIYSSIVLCFKIANMAGLNIGIAQSIWALNPFMVAVMERIVWGVSL